MMDDFIEDEDYQKAYEDCSKIRRLPGSIVKTTRGRLTSPALFIGHWLLAIYLTILAAFIVIIVLCLPTLYRPEFDTRFTAKQ